jgi:hypothetical protein
MARVSNCREGPLSYDEREWEVVAWRDYLLCHSVAVKEKRTRFIV